MAPTIPESNEPRRCDYEGKDYEGDFWKNAGREYEDATERIALKKLLPANGRNMIEIGAGFGRLADLYTPRYEHVFLLDYSPTLVEQAAKRLEGVPNITFVVGDIYNLPFNEGVFDVGVMVRVLHHIENVPRAFGEIRRIMHPGSRYVMEYPNKRHLKAVIRRLLGGKDATPFSLEPLRLDDLYYNYHPAYVETALKRAGFMLADELAVSFFRLGALKRAFGPETLATLDNTLQRPLAWTKATPSIFLESIAVGEQTTKLEGVWRCPACGKAGLTESDNSLECPQCGAAYEKRGRIYYFR